MLAMLADNFCTTYSGIWTQLDTCMLKKLKSRLFHYRIESIISKYFMILC